MRARLGAWFALLGLCAGGAVATSFGVPGVPPTTLGVVAYVVVVVLMAAFMVRSDWHEAGQGPPEREGRRTGLLVAALLVAVALVSAQDFMRPGVSRAHDLGYHAWAIWSNWRGVLDGDWFPRWNPRIGLGMPLLGMYSPLSHLAAWPAQLFGASPIEAIKTVVVGGQVLTALCTFASARWAGASRSASLLGAFALCLAPYHLTDQTLRLSMGENAAFFLLVPVSVALWKVARGERGVAVLVLAASVALLLLTHLLSIITLFTTLIPVVAWALWSTRRRRPGPRRALAGLVLAGALSVGMTAAWWLPLVVDMNYTSVGTLVAGGGKLSPMGIRPDEPWRRRAWQRYGVRRHAGKDEDPGLYMPMYFGWGLTALVAAGIAAPRRKDEGDEGDEGDGGEEGGGDEGDGGDEGGGDALDVVDERLASAAPAPAQLWAVVSLVSLSFAFEPVARYVIDGVPPLDRLQFPWRFLGPATATAVLAGVFALDSWFGSRPRLRGVVAAVTLAFLAWDASLYLGAPARWPDSEGLGLTVYKGGKAVPLDIPRHPFARLEQIRMPPSDYDWDVALARRAFPEYMTPKLRKNYGKRSNPPSVERSEFYGASWRIRNSTRVRKLDPQPLVSYRRLGGEYQGLAEARWTRKPEHIRIELPAELAQGKLRFTESWFPGWRVRVDGGRWKKARRSKSLLATDFPAGARLVEFRYAWFWPLYRPLGGLLSVLSLIAFGFMFRRLRR